MSEMSTALAALGIDPETLEWQDLALCHSVPTNMFFGEYESDEQVATTIDDMCLSCPVMKQCLTAGIENSEWGCWGGVYLVLGKRSEARNAHKTPEVWDKIKKIMSESDA